MDVSILAYPSGFPVKELSLLVPLIDVPQGEMLHYQSPHLSKSLVNESPSRFPNGASKERDARLQSLPLHILQGPQTIRGNATTILDLIIKQTWRLP
jgi:hypothetical protein